MIQSERYAFWCFGFDPRWPVGFATEEGQQLLVYNAQVLMESYNQVYNRKQEEHSQSVHASILHRRPEVLRESDVSSSALHHFGYPAS